MEKVLLEFIKLIDSEDNYQRWLSVSLTGIIFLTVYFIFKDIIISFSTILIFYPLFRFIFSLISIKYNKYQKKKRIIIFFDNISEQEKLIIQQFTRMKDNNLRCSYMSSFLNSIYSLIDRKILSNVNDRYILDIDYFNKAKEIYGKI